MHVRLVHWGVCCGLLLSGRGAVYGDELISIDSPPAAVVPATEPDAGGDTASAAPTATIQSTPAADDSGSNEPAVTRPPLSPAVQALGPKLRQVLATYAPRHLNTRDDSPWEVMHWIIAYGTDSMVRRGGPQGEPITAVGWLCYNGPCRGEKMLYVEGNRLAARLGPGLQGHDCQFLAILAQARVKPDYPLLVDGRKFTVQDLIEAEKLGCRSGEELTFKLIGLMHYLDSDEQWTNRQGEKWSVSRLVREEIQSPIRGAACGGTHRLMGLSYAVAKRIKRGKPVDGEFRRAQTYLHDYHRYTFSLQNADGSMSTQWFTRREADPDLDRRLKTTGHIVEWLAFSLSDEELQQPAMASAVAYLAGILAASPSRQWEVGPLGHGLRGLRLYHERLFAADAESGAVARRPRD